MTGPVGVGLIGAGTISDTYLENMTSFPDLSVRRIADLDVSRAAAQAAEHGVPAAGTVAELLDDPAVEIVVNLTVPAAHVEVGLAALDAGKHVWAEKPLALDRPSGRKLLDRARERGLRVASAPDTVLGAAFQTVRRTAARIGAPRAALAMFQSPGPESWHHSPEFLFRAGGGPLLDIGPYYLTSLVHLLGPARRVTAAGTRARETRTIGAGPRAGTTFAVEVPTTVSALVEFAGGTAAQVLFSFDSPVSRVLLEVTGTEGALVAPDPNRFDGDTTLVTATDTIEIPASGHPATRGTGVLDLARSLRAGEPERASGEVAYHVLDVMLSITESLGSGNPVAVESTASVPPLLPEGWDPYSSTVSNDRT